MGPLPEDLIRLVLSMFIGGLIGAERELRDKTAGLRTLMFISVGSTLFTILSIRLSAVTGAPADPARIAAQIVTGIGFLGAGAILRHEGEVQGLTTASTIWLVAALGMGVGAGEYAFSVAAAVLILLALVLFPAVERLMGQVHQVHIYRIKFLYSDEKVSTLRNLFATAGLQVMTQKFCRQRDEMVCTWRASGKTQAHRIVLSILIEDKEIIEVES